MQKLKPSKKVEGFMIMKRASIISVKKRIKSDTIGIRN